jgi:hypothetical protein
LSDHFCSRQRGKFKPARFSRVQPEGVSELEIRTWIRRLGFWGFMFFLAKGLLWLALPTLLALWASD